MRKNPILTVRRALLAAVSVWAALGLTACGGGHGGGPAPMQATVSGQAVKGPVANGTVTAYSVVSGTQRTVLDTAATDVRGHFQLTLTDYTGPVLLEITGGSYLDEATGQPVEMPKTAGLGLQAAVSSVAAGDDLQLQITPLTSMAVARARALPGGFTAGNIDAANQNVGAHFGGIDVLHTQPIDPLIPQSAAGAPQAAVDYGMILAGLSQEAQTLGLAQPMDLISALSQDFSDGTFDGRSGASNVQLSGTSLGPAAGTAGIATAVNTFQSGSENASGGAATPSLLNAIRQVYAIGGTVTGLTGAGLILNNNGGDGLPIAANGPFTFATLVPGGGAYDVAVAAQPSGQTCTVSNGAGTVGSAGVTGVGVACSDSASSTLTIGGTVTGLTGPGLVLENNGGDDLAVGGNGSFTFQTALQGGASYDVTIAVQPDGETCVAIGGNGTVGSANVTAVEVSCAVPVTGNVLLDSGALTLSERDAAVVTLTLPAAAGPGGQAVTLVSGDPSVAQVEASVVVPEGETDGYFDVDAVGPGTTSVQVGTAGLASVQLSVTVQQRDFSVDTPATVATGQSQSGHFVLKAPAPANGASLSVTSSAPGILNILTPTINISAGQIEGDFSFEGVAPGLAQIIVAGAANEQGIAAEDVDVAQAAGSTALTSGALIDQAVDAGAITAQQALVYKVLAAFQAPSLPSQYQGLPDDREFESIATELIDQYSSLSPEQQTAVAPYLSPPAYSGTGSQIMALSRSASTVRSVAGGAVKADVGANWASLGTRHFKIWYRTDPPQGLYTVGQAVRAAKNLAANVEKAYGKLAGLLGSGLMADTDQSLNGGDGRYDVYVVSLGTSGWTKPYVNTCFPTPSYILASVAHAQSMKWAHYIAAHELMHAFQLSTNKWTGCGGDHWMFEATAEWAVDYVYPGDQSEWSAAAEYFGGGAKDGTLAASGDPRRAEFRFPLDKSAGTRKACVQGYCDYVFFFYLAHQRGPSVIASVFTQWASSDAVASINAALGGQLSTVWHQFAEKSWNDWGDPELEADFSHWDPNLPYGMRWTYEQATNDTIKVDLQGSPQRVFKSEFVDRMGFNSVPKDNIYRLSATPLHFTFDDDSVDYVVFANIPSAIPNLNPNLKILGRAKIDGKWEDQWNDWTHTDAATWCRDKKTERIEELVVLFSNGDTAGRGMEGMDLTGATPELIVSNGGCWRWKGSSSVTLTTPAGFSDLEESKDVIFERAAGDTTHLVVGQAPYETSVFYSIDPVFYADGTSPGTAHISAGGPTAVGSICSISENGSGPIAVRDGQIVVHLLDPMDDAFSGQGSGIGQTSVTGVSLIEKCSGVTVVDTTETAGVSWEVIPEHSKLSADGRTLSGNFDTDDIDPTDGTLLSHKHYEWNLQAVKED